jgi:hypothetical protein
LKRALTGIAAASMALGMMAPAAFAATTSSSIQWKTISITAGSSYTASPKGFSGYDHGSTTLTTFAPVYYVEAALKALGYTVSWDGTSLMIQTPNGVQPNLSNISVGTGDVGIYVNGTLVKKVYKQVAGDPASGGKIQTSYIPIYYIDALLQAAGESATWNGSGWALTAPTSSTTSGFSAFTVSGAQLGSGTVANPAVSSNGGAVTLSTTLSDSNGMPVANSAVNVTVSGGAGNTPVVQGNGTYLTTTANNATASSATSWTTTVNTDASGKLALSIVGTGAYTVTVTSANNSSATENGYVNFLGSNGLLTPSASSGAGYGVNISTPTSPAAGVQAVTFTLPLSSSGTVQANTEVTFTLTNPSNGAGFFSTSTGASLGTNTLTTYSNASGQATVYVNDYQTDSNVEVSALVTGSTATPATTYLSYSNPAAPSTSAALNNIGAFAFAGSAAASTTAPSSLVGLPVTNSVYFVPTDANAKAYNFNDGSVTYVLSASNGATIAGINLGSTFASTANLPSALTNGSNITLQFMVNSAGTAYDVYANGVNITPSTAPKTSDFSVALGNANNVTISNSTLTVTSGSKSATAGFTFSGSNPVYVTNFSPVVSTIGANGTGNVTFQVDDSSGNPVKNSPVTIDLGSSLSAGLFITAVNGTQLTQSNGNGGTEYVPIPLTGGSGTVSYSTLVPGVASWAKNANSFSAYTDANGDVTLTIQNGGVFVYDGTSQNVPYAGGANTSVDVSVYTNTTNTSTSVPAIQFGSSSLLGTGSTQIGSVNTH